MLIMIEFTNLTSDKGNLNINTTWDSAGYIIDWYGSHYSGDNWSWRVMPL